MHHLNFDLAKVTRSTQRENPDRQTSSGNHNSMQHDSSWLTKADNGIETRSHPSEVSREYYCGTCAMRVVRS